MTLAIVTAARDAAQADSTAVVDLVKTIVVVVGFVAAVQQLVSFLANRRFTKEVQQAAYEAAQRSIDAEGAEKAYNEYSDLAKQLRDEIPREAKRVYLRARIEALEEQMGADVEEHEALSRQLSRIEGGEPKPLDRRLKNMIEGSIRPAYVRRKATERIVAWSLVALVVLALSPFNLFVFVGRAVPALWNPDQGHADELVVVAIFGALVFAGLAFTLARLSITSHSRLLTSRLSALACTAMTLGGLALIGADFTLQHSAVVLQGQVQDLDGDVYLAQSKAEHNRRYRKYTRAFDHEDDVDTDAAICLVVGISSTGIGAGLLAAQGLRRRRLRTGTL